MTKILKIDSSIKGPASVTRKLTDEIVAKLGGTVTERDTTSIPLIDGTWIGAAYTPKDARTAEQNATLALSDELIAEIKAAEVIVIGAPIYNFGVTGPLKAWIDQICRVGETFQYTEAGPQGLVGAKRVIVAYASGGVPLGSAYDLATAYIKQVLGFIGITDVSFVAAEGVAVDEAAAVARAEAQIAALAA
ncbi:FMN-dependent NADH-azoreductase [Rhodobacter xanthinilyticus]|uniref:FMN dependent NADH:quinone oxidoreductase n=1 Tax=Rhodobacter xanthinilyticus TaxID=1850250 RepID=A0A1D9M912_9RHOB|nr:NAD(P)H-dependent oxidoreductase [Rhodobacter xanthinilyticus]AOZ68342.1 FMN-dependent NADH-azoreductase [Rhodobacter xanthinilyticus]